MILENNLFYTSAELLICYHATDFDSRVVEPILRGNTFVQDVGPLLFVKTDEAHGRYIPETTVTTGDIAYMEKCICEYIGDESGAWLLFGVQS